MLLSIMFYMVNLSVLNVTILKLSPTKLTLPAFYTYVQRNCLTPGEEQCQDFCWRIFQGLEQRLRLNSLGEFEEKG
jgi:hypothetical protein